MYKLKLFLKTILKSENIYFFTIDHLFNKIVLFCWVYKIEVFIDIINNKFSIKVEKFESINEIYKFVNNIEYYPNIEKIIYKINYFKEDIFKFYKIENLYFYKTNFKKLSTEKEILLILKWWWIEETIEKSFIAFCTHSNIKLKVLYKFWLWYWWQQINQNWFIQELEKNNPKVNFIHNENFDDEYIDSIITTNTEIFSFQYNYNWKNKNLNLIILSSVSDDEINLDRYKNIYTCYIWDTIWYSSDKFTNSKNKNIFRILNPQNINLINNYTLIKPINKFIISWWMSWARDFSILNKLKSNTKWILITDESKQIDNFKIFYRWIHNYYAFLWVFFISNFWIFCHLDEFNNDDRTKMIATNICFWKPSIIPYNSWKLVKLLNNKNLWFTYLNNNSNDLNKKVSLLNENNYNYISLNAKNYSNKDMDVNKFINFIFNNSLNCG